MHKSEWLRTLFYGILTKYTNAITLQNLKLVQNTTVHSKIVSINKP